MQDVSTSSQKWLPTLKVPEYLQWRQESINTYQHSVQKTLSGILRKFVTLFQEKINLRTGRCRQELVVPVQTRAI